MTEILIFLAYVGLLLGGLAAPFVTSLGYLWADSFYPQYLARSILGGFPVSTVMGASAVLAYILMDRRAPPRLGAPMIMTGIMVIWMTASLTWAVRPDSAFSKWDFAVKTVGFSLFLPFVFRSRVQLEAMLLAHILGSGMHLIAVGIKGAVTGGGYQWRLTQLPGDYGLNETSAMATVAIMFIPLLLFMRRHSILIPFKWIRLTFFTCYAMLCVTAMIATGARTGLVCAAVLGTLYWLQSSKKVITGVAVAMLGVLLLVMAPDRWKERMATIDDYQTETSASTRLKVWAWIIDYAKDNPMGGSFRAYEINIIHMPANADNPDGWIQRGRAPHSTWFEMLSELGYPGLILFLTLIAVTFASHLRVWRRTHGVEELQWCADLARALAMALAVLCAGSSFIGIAFQPWYWIMFAASFILSEYVRRVLSPAKPLPGWMPAQPVAPARPSLPPVPQGGGLGGSVVRRRV